MSCPICGAKCRCKKAGPGGICCSCHRHKATAQGIKAHIDAGQPIRVSPSVDIPVALIAETIQDGETIEGCERRLRDGTTKAEPAIVTRARDVLGLGPEWKTRGAE